MCCLIPGCKSNYKGQGDFITAFSFPKDLSFREQWFRSIPRPRKDYENNKQMKVCIHHFKEDDIIRTIEYFDGERIVTVPRERVALKKDAVPTIFPNCPSYLSDLNSRPKRLSKDDKEELMFQAAYIQSLADNQETVDKFLVNSHSDLLSKLKLIDLRNGWISHISQNDPIFFMKIVISDSRPTIERSISIDDELFVKAFDYLHNPILLDLQDRGSLKYPSESVYESVVIMYEIFIKIENEFLS